VVRVVVGLVVSAAPLAGCGGDDTDGADGAPVAGELGGEAADVTTEDAAPDATSVGGPACDEIFTIDEVASFIGEDVTVTRDEMPSIGQVSCTWETVEDPADTEDLAFGLITVQVFTGDPVPAASFVDPDAFDGVTMLDGLGDVAFYEESFGRTYYFLDGGTAGVFSYTDADLGDVNAPPRRTPEETEELVRLFHDRVT
jgi:hypothetical protein